MLRALIAAALSGALFFLAFPWWPGVRLESLGWIGLTPLLWVLSQEPRPGHRGLGQAIVASLTFALVLQGLCLSGLFVLKGPETAWLLLNAPGMALPLILFHLLQRAYGLRTALWSLPFLWTGWEYLHTTQWPVNAPWWVLGLSLARLTALNQFADLAGTWGLSFWLVSINCLVLALVLRWRDQEQRLAPLAALALLFVLPLAYAALARPPTADTAPALTVMAVEPGLAHIDDDPLPHPSAVTQRALQDGAAPDLIVWPESITTVPVAQDLQLRNRLLQAVLAWQRPLLLVGTEYGEPAPKPQAPPRLYGVNAMFTPQLADFVLANYPNDGLPIVLNRKRRLTPFAEFLPFMEQSDTWREWYETRVRRDERPWFTPGTLPAEPLKFIRGDTAVAVGAITCFELLFAEEVAQVVADGAQILAWMTNDAHAERGMYTYQFAQFGRLRAIETRRDLVRVNSDGGSFSVSAWGEMSDFSPRDQAGYSLHTLMPRQERSLYVRHPRWLPLACGAVFALLLAALPIGYWQRRHSRPRGVPGLPAADA